MCVCLFFLVDEGKKRIQIPLLAGHQGPASETLFKMAIRWRADYDPPLNVGLVSLRFFSRSGPVFNQY